MQIIIPKFFLAFTLNIIFIKMETSRILALSFTDLQDTAHVLYQGNIPILSFKRESLSIYLIPVSSSRGERILFFGPNTNMNNIRNQILDQIRIRIIFVFSEWANTNTNNIRAQIFGRIRIRIIFGFRIVPEYEYE